MANLVPIQTLDLVLTSRCNLKCAYCFENDKKNLSMSWDIARAALDRALAAPGNEFQIVFFGGEPGLEFPLIRRCVHYCRGKLRRGRKPHFTLITNGTLLGEDEFDFLEEHSVDVSISFDGVPQAQAFRGRGTFDVLDALLDILRTRRSRFFTSHVSVQMTLHPRTVPYLGDSVSYFLRKGLATIDVAPKITHDPSWKVDDIGHLDAAFRGAYRASLSHFRKTGKVPFAYFRRRAGEREARPASVQMCGVGNGQKLAVDVDGQAHGCILFADSYQKFPSTFLRDRLGSIRLGDVRSEVFERRRDAYPAAARASGLFDNKQDKYSSYGPCGGCRHLATCSVCPTGIGHIPGNTDPNRVPDFACAFNLIAQKYRAKFPVRGAAGFQPRALRAGARVKALIALARTMARDGDTRRT